jgi:hypothetical protein
MKLRPPDGQREITSVTFHTITLLAKMLSYWRLVCATSQLLLPCLRSA